MHHHGNKEMLNKSIEGDSESSRRKNKKKTREVGRRMKHKTRQNTYNALVGYELNTKYVAIFIEYLLLLHTLKARRLKQPKRFYKKRC